MADRSESSIGLLLLPIVLYLIGAVVFFRWQILSTFDLISGSDETLLVAFIHEHVYRSLLIHSGLLSPPFFFNQPNTRLQRRFPFERGRLRTVASPGG